MSLFGVADDLGLYSRPPGRITENYPRVPGAIGIFTLATGGNTYFLKVKYNKGDPVTNIGFRTAATAANTPTSCWLGLWTHDAPPPIVTTYQGNDAAFKYSSVRTSGNTTVTAASGVTYPLSLTARRITGTGIPADTWVVSQTTTTLVLSAAPTASGTSLLTPGQYMGALYNIGFTANGGTTPVPANTEVIKALTVGPVIIPATGNYFHSFSIATSGGPNLVSCNGSTSISIDFWDESPSWGRMRTGPDNTAPGSNPATSVTALRNFPYTFST